jgi:predicted nucleic acid-binding protein
MRFLDTNILIYAASANPIDADKRGIARALLRADDNVVSVQVLQEFFVQMTRPTRTDRLSDQDALSLIETWMRFPVQVTGANELFRAIEIKSRYKLSYWDAAVIACALAAGCSELLSEDMQAGLRIDGLTIINPFL